VQKPPRACYAACLRPYLPSVVLHALLFLWWNSTLLRRQLYLQEEHLEHHSSAESIGRPNVVPAGEGRTRESVRSRTWNVTGLAARSRISTNDEWDLQTIYTANGKRNLHVIEASASWSIHVTIDAKTSQRNPPTMFPAVVIKPIVFSTAWWIYTRSNHIPSKLEPH